MMRWLSYDYEQGETEGRTVYVADEESSVLGPDGEPLRKSTRRALGFDLTPRRKRSEREGWNAPACGERQ